MAEINNDTVAAMNVEDQLKAGWSQLTLVLSFFSRIDTKLSVILGLNLGMLAMLSTRLPVYADLKWWHFPLFALCSPLIVSLSHLYRGAVPDTRGGSDSLIYFGNIAGMAENSFQTATHRRTDAELVADVYAQVWRNAEILADKFQALQRAYLWLLRGVVPWLITLAALSTKT